MLLMFGVGMHFRFGDLLAVRRVAIPGALGQIMVAMASASAPVSIRLGLVAAVLVLGLAISVASTVVLLRALENAMARHAERVASRSAG